MIAYVVTSGCYSDYSIRGVFSSQEKAEAYIREGGTVPHWDLAEIEEWEIDAEEAARATEVYSVMIRADGSLFAPPYPHHSTQLIKPGQLESAGRCDTGCFFANSTESAEHALKLAAECRQAYLRETKGNA